MPLNLAPGQTFPDLELTDDTGRQGKISEFAQGRPLILVFYRGHW